MTLPKLAASSIPTPRAAHLAGTSPVELGSTSTHDELVRKTQKWVSQTFFGTLLKHMHDSPFKSTLMDGGRGGQAFSSLYDQQLADRMSRGAGAKLVNSIVRKIEATAAYQKNSRAGAPSPVAATAPGKVAPTAPSGQSQQHGAGPGTRQRTRHGVGGRYTGTPAGATPNGAATRGAL